ncbi:MAG: 2OG-Fe(II) oxygenase [Terriglobales bacterium]
MPQTHDAEIFSLLKRRINVHESLEHLAASYRTARPFPHLVIDDMFEDALLDRLLDEMPALTTDKFVYCGDEHLTQYGLRSAVDLGDAGSQLVSFLHSAPFLYFLAEVTGIWELLPDPYLQGGGYHVIPKNGAFDVHADRNTAYETGLIRRLSLIIYLNKSWKHEYGGQFELWNANGTRRVGVVEPVFNRTVIFEIADQNFHGVPSPVACPSGRSRKSFTVYYHTARLPDQDVVAHSSLYSPSFYQPKMLAGNKNILVRAARALCPPIFVPALRKLLRRRRILTSLPPAV